MKVFEALFLEELLHFLGVGEHLGIVEKNVDCFGVLGEDALVYLLEFGV